MKFKTKKKIVKVKHLFIQFIQIIVGTMIIAIATSVFLLPNQLSAGGFSGIATITYYLFKIPMRHHDISIKYSIIYNILDKKW